MVLKDWDLSRCHYNAEYVHEICNNYYEFNFSLSFIEQIIKLLRHTEKRRHWNLIKKMIQLNYNVAAH